MALRRTNRMRDLTNDPLTASKLDPTEVKKSKRRTNRMRPSYEHQKLQQVGKTGLGESQFDKNINIESLANLHTIRAAKQPWHHQAANMLGQAVAGEIVGGTIEGLGYITDVEGMYDFMRGKEADWGNAISDLGKGIREGTEEKLKIYQTDPGGFNPSDTGWWFGNGVSVASTLSLLIPSMAATKALSFLGKGVSRGAGMIDKSLDIAAKMGSKSKWISTGVSQAVVSRHMENMMEASGTFNEKFEEYKSQGMDEGIAKELASEAASFNYNTGWAMLLQDIPQYLLIGKVFNPITGKVQSKLGAMGAKGVKPGFTKKTATALAAYGSEGFEEGYQYAIAEEGKYKSDLKAGLIDESTFDKRMQGYMKEGEFWTSVTFGALGAAVFQSVGPGVGDLFKSKKQKEATRNYLKNKEEIIKNNGMNAALMHDIVAEADQEGNILNMKAARRAVNLSVTIDAIEADGIDTHLETLNNLRDISEEEIAELEKQGVTVNKDILQEMIPELVEQSVELNNNYIKLAQKHNPAVARNMAINKMHIKNFSKNSKEAINEFNKLKKAVPGAEKVTSTGNQLLDSHLKIKAYEQVNAFHEKRLAKNKDKQYQETIQKQIDDNKAGIKKEEKNIEKQIKSDQRIPAEKRSDTIIRKRALADAEIASKQAHSILAEQKIDQYSDELIEMSSPAYSKKIELEQTKKMFAQLNNKEDIEKAIETLNEPGDQTFDDPKDKEISIEALKDRLRSIKIVEAKEAGKKAQAEILRKQKLTNPKSIKREQNQDVLDNLEDPMGDLNVDDGPVMQAQDNAVYIKGGQTNFLRLLDQDGSPLYQEWLVDGHNKVGSKVEYSLGDDISANAGATLKLFREAKSFEELSQEVFDWLPIKVTFNDNPELFGFIGDAKQRNVTVSENQIPYDQSEALERKRIIEALFAGDPVITEVGKQLGGELVLDEQFDEATGEQLLVDNNILDLAIDANTVSELEIYFSNENGLLFDEDKTTHVDMDFTMLAKDPGDNGDTKPYAGGIFLKVQRANGFNFPLRLNMTKSTITESETLADLMIGATILKTIKYTDTLVSLKESNPVLYKKITTEHKKEFDMLGKEASVHDFIQTFVYMNDRTTGLNSALYQAKMLNGQYGIMYGKGNRLTPENSSSEKAKLVQWLTNEKRRQLSRKSWSKSDNPNWKKYREYLVSNNILSTNAITKSPLFQKSAKDANEDRPINLYAKSIKGEAKDNTIQERKDRSGKHGIKRMGTTFVGAYYDNTGTEKLIYGDDPGGIQILINKKYDEELNDVEAPAPVPTPAKTEVKEPIVKKEVPFPETQERTRTKVTTRLLNKVAEVMENEPYSGNLVTGDYIPWLKTQGNLGQEVAELLNKPAEANRVIEAKRIDIQVARRKIEGIKTKAKKKVVPSQTKKAKDAADNATTIVKKKTIIEPTKQEAKPKKSASSKLKSKKFKTGKGSKIICKK